MVNLTSGRYNVMAAALIAAAMAGYFSFREKRLTAAVLLANACVAAAVVDPTLMAPSAGWLSCWSSPFTDRARFHPRLLVVAALPYLLALAAWGAFIAQDPAMFRQQFAANAAGRRLSLLHPLAALASEIQIRYITIFGGWHSGVPVYMRVKVGLLLLYLAALIGCLASARVRNSRGGRSC